jgi:hypothetical protein
VKTKMAEKESIELKDASKGTEEDKKPRARRSSILLGKLQQFYC